MNIKFIGIAISNKKRLKTDLIIVDAKGYELINQYRWHLDKDGYPILSEPVAKNVGVRLAHHLILPKRKGFDVDHKNGHRCDIRGCNLRYVTRSQNNFNRYKPSNSKTGYRGIRQIGKKPPTYQARINIDGREVNLGCFPTIDEAIKVRHKADIKYSGNPNRIII